jgi:hypothetical protein
MVGSVKIVKISSYSENLPESNCMVKVAVKKSGWFRNDCIKTQVYENAIYEDGFVSLDGGNDYYLGFNFLFHKMKRKNIE